MKIDKFVYGNLNGKTVTAYKLINDQGMYATFIDLGATNINLVVKDKNGNFRDIVLQYEDLQHLSEGKGFFGDIVARNCNRIKGAVAHISGVDYKLAANNNGNNLHSGPDVFHSKMTTAKIHEEKDNVSVEFSYRFKDMEQGYPGNMDFSITYTLTNDDELKIKYQAISDKDTIFNPTWHAYFNLAGFDYGDISSHKIKINATKFLYVDETLIPEKLENVNGTKLDFTDFRYMNDGIDDEYIQIKRGEGFDHNFALNDYSGNVRKVCEVIEDKSGIKMEAFTDLPGMQFYSGNNISTPYKGKNGFTFKKRGGFCLEMQYFPNAINDGRFVSPLLKKGIKKEIHASYKFSIA